MGTKVQDEVHLAPGRGWLWKKNRLGLLVPCPVYVCVYVCRAWWSPQLGSPRIETLPMPRSVHPSMTLSPTPRW